MNTSLLRLATRPKGCRREWTVPHAPHSIKQSGPEHNHSWATHGTGELQWPDFDMSAQGEGDWMLRAVRMDWHLRKAFRAIRNVLETLPTYESSGQDRESYMDTQDRESYYVGEDGE